MTRETWEANLKIPNAGCSVSSPTELGIRSPGGSGHYSMPCSLMSRRTDVSPSSRRAPCSTTRSHPPYPTASAPTLSSLTAKG
jgi:hypothetical protein